MQERAMYEAILSELTDEEFVEIIGREMRRRNASGIISLFRGNEIRSASVYPLEWEGFDVLPLSNQFRVFAAWATQYGTDSSVVIREK